MRYNEKVTVFLHSDAVTDCDCGDREWEVQLPCGWMWKSHEGPGPFVALTDAMDYAVQLYPDHPDIKRCDPSIPDRWDFP